MKITWITQKELKEINNIRKEIHKIAIEETKNTCIMEQVDKYVKYEHVTGTLFKISHKKRSFKNLIKVLFNK